MKIHQAVAALLLAAIVLSSSPGVAIAQDGDLRISTYRVTLQRDAEHLVVREAYSFENDGDQPLLPPGGALLFDLPYDIHGPIGATVLSGGERSQGQLVQDTTDPAVHGLQMELPPGRTTVTLSYQFHPAAESPFQPRIFYPMDQGRLFVQPEDMHVHGGATKDASSPMTGFASWTLAPLSQPGQLDLTLSGGSGGGAAHDHGDESQSAMQRARAQEEWRVSVRNNRFTEGQLPILIGLFLATILGLGLLYGINSGRGMTQERAAKLKVTEDLTRLEDRFVSGQIEREEFLQHRERILRSGSGGKDKGARKRQPVG